MISVKLSNHIKLLTLLFQKFQQENSLKSASVFCGPLSAGRSYTTQERFFQKWRSFSSFSKHMLLSSIIIILSEKIGYKDVSFGSWDQTERTEKCSCTCSRLHFVYCKPNLISIALKILLINKLPMVRRVLALLIFILNFNFK